MNKKSCFTISKCRSSLYFRRYGNDGIKVDSHQIEKLQTEFAEILTNIEKIIYDLAGEGSISTHPNS